MPRYFTRDQAERLLPQVEGSIREALFVKAEFQEADNTLRDATRAIMLSGGMNVDRDRLLETRQRRDNSVARLQQALERIHEYGCQVKDLDIGLLDFPSLYHGQEVLLCWRLGEQRIEFWHGIEEGFRGRKPIDDEFIANHIGDAAD
jgi:hypothetical protein